MNQKSTTSARGTLHSQPLPYYVKHNQGSVNLKHMALASPTCTPRCTPAPVITAQLLLSDDKQYKYIVYNITDCEGVPGRPHSKNTKNESPSTLYSAKFKPDADTDIDVVPTDDKKEVIIKGTTEDGVTHEWKSDSCQPPPDDNDVTWTP